MVKVFITIDVETSIGGAFQNPDLLPVGVNRRIFGEMKGRHYGIPLIMDILEENGLKGNFFVEPFFSFYFGKEKLKKVCRTILKRGHDVELHIHPNYQTFLNKDWRLAVKRGKLFSDLMSDYDLEGQKSLIEKAKNLLVDCGVSSLAFRSGSFSADQNTIYALKENRIFIDSSFNASFTEKECSLDLFGTVNDVCEKDGMIEFPITNYYYRTGSFKKLRHLDVCAASFGEVSYVLKECLKHGPDFVTIILHSFSFLKTKDFQYKRLKPNFITINRFKKLCRFLKDNEPLFKVCTFEEFHKTRNKINSSRHFFHEVPRRLVFIRLLEQLIQRL